MPLYWIAKQIEGEPRYFIQEANWPIYAMLRAAIAGFDGGRTSDVLELDVRTARKVPKKMIGRVLTQREAEALLRRIAG